MPPAASANRRDFLAHAFFGAALGAVALGSPARALASTLLHPAFLFHPLGPGADLGLGWSLLAVYPPHEGAITLTLAHASGERVRVDVCLKEGAGKGPATTELLDFIVMDGGDGTAPMQESLGRALRRLAAVAAENEGQSEDSLSVLSTHAARVWSHPDSLAAASTRLLPGAPRPSFDGSGAAEDAPAREVVPG
jgi:hypothetical protein